MDTDLRTSLVAAAVAAFLSALVGIVSGVAFAALLLRAVLFGVLFGALAYGGLLLARRVLPGLASEGASAGDLDGEGSEFRGRTVDIVLPGEAPADFGGNEDELESLPDGDAAEEAVDASPSPPAEQAPRVPAAASRPAARRHPDAVPEEAPEELGSLLEPDGTDGGPIAVPRAEDPGRVGSDELDVLPDLDGFSDSFAPVEYRGATAGPDSKASRRPAGGASSGLSRGDPRTDSLDPAQLAQAVRTILKRDQKG